MPRESETLPSDEARYLPSLTQRQADFFQHASHDPDYAAMRQVPSNVARGRHNADIAAGLWGKAKDSACVKCEQAKAEKEKADG